MAITVDSRSRYRVTPAPTVPMILGRAKKMLPGMRFATCGIAAV
jgi:hypothetical protein